MKIKALKSFCGTVTMSPSDTSREVPDNLAENLIAAGYAAKVEDNPEPNPDETSKPENKAPAKKENTNAAK